VRLARWHVILRHAEPCGITLDEASIRWAAGEGVSETIITAALLLHERSVEEVAAKLRPITGLAEIPADEVLDCGDRIFRGYFTPIILPNSAFRCSFAVLPFRRFFSNHHGEDRLVTRLIVVGDGDPNAVGLGLQKVGVVTPATSATCGTSRPRS